MVKHVMLERKQLLLHLANGVRIGRVMLNIVHFIRILHKISLDHHIKAEYRAYERDGSLITLIV
jgi:hypothetical protein